MSKTDKTRPTWVQMMDQHNRGWREEWHNHECGPCDLADHDPSVKWRARTRCSYWPSYTAMHDGIHPRSSAVVAMYRHKENGRCRTEWRRVSRELLKSDRQAVYDSEYLAEQHRHRGLWDV